MKLVPGPQLNIFQRAQVRIRFNLWHLGQYRAFEDFINAHHFWITKGGYLSKKYGFAVPNQDVEKWENLDAKEK